MNNLQTYLFKIALLFSAIFVFTNSAVAQKNWFELLPGSESLSYDEKSGVERLTGVLCFSYQGNIMYCDSAHLKRKTKEIWAYGKVHLNKRDTLNLFCDSLYYNGQTKMAKLWGNVRVRDREYKLTTDTLEYDTKRSKAIYRYGGKIENITTNEVLTSQIGYFYPNTEESFFKGKVVYKGKDLKMTTDTLRYDYLSHRVYIYGLTDIKHKQTKIKCSAGWFDVFSEEALLQKSARIEQEIRILEGDSLYYAPLRKIGEGRGNIKLTDKKEKIILTGGYFFGNDSLKSEMITKKPLIRMMKSQDTMTVRADTLIHYRDSLNRSLRLKGLGNVLYFQEKIQAKSDSLDYQKEKARIDLVGSPIFWSNNSELSGDSIRLYLKNDTLIERVHLRNHAFANSELDSGTYYNQLAGKEIWTYLKNNELTLAEVKGNAQIIYFPEEEQKTDSSLLVIRKGMNRVYAASLKVYMDSGEVSGITFVSEPDGVFYPMDKINKQEQFLQGFTWHPALRPKSWEELKR